MAIVKMKKLTAILPKDVRREVLRQLYTLGCVELESASPTLLAEHEDLLHLSDESTGAADSKALLLRAVAALTRYAPVKTSMLAPRRPVTEKQLFSRASLDSALEYATQISDFNAQIDDNAATRNRLSVRIAGLKPWETMEVPLEYEGSASTAFISGVLPAMTDLTELMSAISADVPASQLDIIGSDREQHYLTLLVLRTCEDTALALLKQKGFMTAGLKGMTGTVSENISQMTLELAALETDSAKALQSLVALAPHRQEIECAVDAYSQEAGQDALLSTVGLTEKTVILNGWVPADAEKSVAAIFGSLGCAWEITEPTPEDNIPVAFKNNSLVDPFVGVTDMYGTPTYNSLIDPNPLMSIFYFVFFGFIMGDAMYGVLMVIGCYLVLKLKRPSGNFKRMVTMFLYCGVSTFVAGALTGGWFADSVSVISLWLTGTAISIPPIWFDPLGNPMMMLVFSLTLGVIQISTGLIIAAWRMIRQGRVVDAICDIGFWFVVFAGVGMYAMKISTGLYVAGIGALLLLLTGGRNNKGLGKITGGLGSLYGITGYISDLLSYSRIMALGLSGAVVGQVINKISTMATGVLGLILFVCVFIGGHLFNIAISLLGAYVHTSRLQYIEFFGRFFEDGGRPFKPLWNNTKFVEIIKED